MNISYILLFCSALTNALGSTIMKHAYGGDTALISSGIVGTVLRIFMNPWTYLGRGLYGVSFIFMASALSRTDLTFAYPMMSGIVYLILLIVGLFVFRENITAFRVAGMFFILVGITLLAAKG